MTHERKGKISACDVNEFKVIYAFAKITLYFIYAYRIDFAK